MKDVLILLLIACTVTLGLYLLHRHDKPEPQETHTPVMKERIRPGCDEADRPNLPCDGVRPR